MESLAIIGTGIAGMGAAYFLRDEFDITFFEKNGYPGGHTNTLTIKVVEFPARVESMSETLAIKQGEKGEVVIKVSRQYEFTGAISVQSQLPGGVGGISIPGANIPENQTEVKYEITAQPNATVGEHLVNVRLQMNFNGQPLIIERPMRLSVVEVKK